MARPLLVPWGTCHQHSLLASTLDPARLQPSSPSPSFAATRTTPFAHLVLSLFRFVLANLSEALILCFLCLVFRYRNTALGVSPRSDLPGPRGWPFLGNTLYMLRRPKGQNYQVQTSFHEQFGKVYTVTVLGFPRVINIRDPHMLEHVLKTQFWKYEKGDLFRTVLGPLIGAGIFGADGQHWRWQRKLVCRIFNVGALREYTSHVFTRQSQLVVDYFNKITEQSDQPSSGAEEAIVDLQSIFLLFTLDTFGEIAFGRTFGCLKNPEKQVEFAVAFDRMNVCLSRRFCIPFWKWTEWWTGKDRQIEKDRRVIQEFAYDLIQQRRREFEQSAMDEAAKNNEDRPKAADKKKFRKDLMQLCMEAEDELGERIEDEELKDMLLNFILAGRDTTAQALSWMFYLILSSDRKEEILKWLLLESDTLFDFDTEAAMKVHPTYEMIKIQRYTEACFFESLRLYPSVPHNIRVCAEDDILPGGVPVYKGEVIAWGSWAMGRDTAIWGSDAKEYRPERWLQGEKFSPSKFVAFNMGPRSWANIHPSVHPSTSLGQQFATIEAITVTLTLLQHFVFELVDPDKEPAYQQALTLPMAHGLHVRIKRRHRCQLQHVGS